jgi:hypothetical protein
VKVGPQDPDDVDVSIGKIAPREHALRLLAWLTRVSPWVVRIHTICAG